MSTEYFHIGAQKSIGTGDIKPFGAFALSLGTKILVSDKLGFRFDRQIPAY